MPYPKATPADEVLGLLSRMTQNKTEHLIIDSDEYPAYVIDNNQAFLNRQHEPFSTEKIHEALRGLVGDKVVDAYEQSDKDVTGKTLTAEDMRRIMNFRIPQVDIEHEGEYFKVTFGKDKGRTLTHIRKLKVKPTSYWSAQMDRIVTDENGGTSLKIGQGNSGTNWMKLNATQLDKVKAFLVEIENN